MRIGDLRYFSINKGLLSDIIERHKTSASRETINYSNLTIFRENQTIT